MPDMQMKILVVDDEKIIRDFLTRLFSSQGMEVTCAEDGFRAVELAKQKSFDLFFIDMRMPGLDGLQTFRQIRIINPSAQIVLMTGYAVEGMLEQAMREGALGVVRKPFDITEIKNIIGNFGGEKPKGPFNILIVDDEDVVLNFFSRFLKQKDIEHKLAHNRDEALSAVKKEKFDLVFLDVMLKDVSGIDLYREIKGDLPEATIILITGYVDKVEELVGDMDVAGCLLKPFDIKNILEHIDKAKAKINK